MTHRRSAPALRTRCAAALVAACWLGRAALAANSASISIRVDPPGHAIPPSLWGIFFEEISHAGEGGLYAELIQNRDFEASTIPEGWRSETNGLVTPLGWRTQKWFTNDLPGWSLVTEGAAAASIALESASPLNSRNPHSLRFAVDDPGARCGIANSGFWGMNVQSGDWYDLSFYARTETNKHFALTVSLESADGAIVCSRATIPEVGGAWKRYTLALQARRSDPRGRIVIALNEPGTLWLDVVSLFPRNTFKGRSNGMRVDLARKLEELHPAFLRFPGGCVVEGATLETRFRWKDSIGDISQRTGGFDLWGYYNTYGLGFHEYLQLAEDLGADPVYVINAGMSCQGRQGELAGEAALKNCVQESLDALEYAMGPTNSAWGAQRAANGHPAPFRIPYVEIGNENIGANYIEHYKAFHNAIKAKYPGILTIANARLEGVPAEFVDDHFYVAPQQFFRMADHYDHADRHGPRIYVGEYAVNSAVGQGNLLGALAEAVFMMDMEKNSDAVRLASYAPLFENVNRSDWPVNLIRFDSSRSVGRTSYYVQRLFNQNRPDVVLDTQVRAPKASIMNSEVQALYALAGLDRDEHEVIVKIVNPTPGPVSAGVTLRGGPPRGGTVTMTTLAHADAIAENTLDQPTNVVPAESEFHIDGPRFVCELKPNSLTILRVPLQPK